MRNRSRAAFFVAPAIVLVFCAVSTVRALQSGAASPPEVKSTYRFRVESVGASQSRFQGSYCVDGRQVHLESTLTPYEFRCEYAARVSGMFRSLEPGLQIKISVFDDARKGRRPIERGHGTAVVFSWAQSGVRPRFVDTVTGSSPGTVVTLPVRPTGVPPGCEDSTRLS